MNIFSGTNLKFSDVLEFFKIPLGLNSVLRRVWQLEALEAAGNDEEDTAAAADE